MKMENKLLGNRRKGRLEELARKAIEDPVFKKEFEKIQKKIPNPGQIVLEEIFNNSWDEWVRNAYSVSAGPRECEFVVGYSANEFSIYEYKMKDKTFLYETGRKKLSYLDSGAAFGVSCSPDGQSMACCDGKAVHIFKVKGLTKFLTKPFGITPLSVSWSWDGKYLAVAFEDAHMKIFKIGKKLELFMDCEDVNDEIVAFGPDNYLFTAKDNEVRLYQADYKNKNLQAINELNLVYASFIHFKANGMSASPDRKHIAVGGEIYSNTDGPQGFITFHEVDYKKGIIYGLQDIEFKGGEIGNFISNHLPCEKQVQDVSFSRDGNYMLVCANPHGQIMLFKIHKK